MRIQIAIQVPNLNTFFTTTYFFLGALIIRIFAVDFGDNPFGKAILFTWLSQSIPSVNAQIKLDLVRIILEPIFVKKTTLQDLLDFARVLLQLDAKYLKQHLCLIQAENRLLDITLADVIYQNDTSVR